MSSLIKTDPAVNSITLRRETKETSISLSLNVDGSQQINIKTGLPFFDHMLEQLASHARWDLTLTCEGDLQVDDHHTIEDVAICLGEALQKSWRNKSQLQRYGQRYLPMDETLTLCAVDLCGRPCAKIALPLTLPQVGNINCEMWPHFFRSLSYSAAITLHLKTMEAGNHHHMIEGAFKALAYALAEALQVRTGAATTKGIL